MFFERGGGAEVELFAAKGAYSTFNANAFRLVGDTNSGGLAVQTVPGGGGAAAGGLAQYIQTDVRGDMKDVASSAYLRTPFFVSSPASLSSLYLNVRYDDGFVAYLNGVEIARRNAPTTTQYNSLSLTDRSETEAAIEETIDVSAHLGQVNTGINVLAVQGLNDQVGSDEFLLTASLADIQVTEQERVYFTSSTPGAFNSEQGVEGFLLNEISFDQPHGFYDAPISVAISAATAGTSIRYTTDGTEPTATNGQVYSGPLTINKTTTLRARAFKTGQTPSYVETVSYLFIDDIVKQSANGAAPAGWPTSTNINGQVLNYGMDPDIVNSPTWGPQLEAALKQIPTMSVVMNINDLLSTSTGIYTHAQNHGSAWERPVSLELIQPDSSEGFQINGGIRIRGGYSRSGGNPKHAFRFFFRDEYGESKLEFPLFDDEGVDEFNSFDLRTAQNYSWSFGGDGNNAFVRDVFSRDVQGEMGNPYTRSRYYHLYINGQYWGLYQTQERAEA
ncbi:MAG: chitobiase/beta-hexosaminidase C-terminal domain-containing protein, partial [Planctomycetales bacterium]|nr:chitobiase/beta-hexosaminidase C-terminal domain-containing protein [Planctomycetales bacterium]